MVKKPRLTSLIKEFDEQIDSRTLAFNDPILRESLWSISYTLITKVEEIDKPKRVKKILRDNFNSQIDKIIELYKRCNGQSNQVLRALDKAYEKAIFEITDTKNVSQTVKIVHDVRGEKITTSLLDGLDYLISRSSNQTYFQVHLRDVFS